MTKPAVVKNLWLVKVQPNTWWQLLNIDEQKLMQTKNVDSNNGKLAVFRGQILLTET